MIEITLNGEKQRFAENTSIEKMLDSLNIKPSVAVVEHNGDITKKELYKETLLKAGDRLEVVRMVCGG